MEIEKFKRDRNALWDPERGLLFLQQIPNQQHQQNPEYNLSCYKDRNVTVGKYNKETLIQSGFHLFPVIFYFSHGDLFNFPLKNYQYTFSLPDCYNTDSFFPHDTLKPFILAFKEQLLTANPHLQMYGAPYIFAELLRARSSCPLLVRRLMDIRCPLSFPQELIQPAILSPPTAAPVLPPPLPPRLRQVLRIPLPSAFNHFRELRSPPLEPVQAQRMNSPEASSPSR